MAPLLCGLESIDPKREGESLLLLVWFVVWRLGLARIGSRDLVQLNKIGVAIED